MHAWKCIHGKIHGKICIESNVNGTELHANVAVNQQKHLDACIDAFNICIAKSLGKGVSFEIQYDHTDFATIEFIVFRFELKWKKKVYLYLNQNQVILLPDCQDLTAGLKIFT